MMLGRVMKRGSTTITILRRRSIINNRKGEKV
jgi:hypothetical protein